MKRKALLRKTIPALALCLCMLAPMASSYAAVAGDADADGSVTVFDARLALREAIGLEHMADEARAAADYDADGSVTVTDARLILRISIGLPPYVDPTEDTPAQPDPPAPPEPTPEEKKEAFLAAMPASVSYEDVSDNMKWLVDDIGVRSWWNSTQNAAANLLYDRLASYGYAGGNLRKQDFYNNGILGRNIVATIPTAAANPDIIVVSAHYDTARETGGAVDNSSGAVALLQLAKRFLYAGYDYGAELRFVFTAGEEQGYYGAYGYLGSLSAAEKSRHVFVYNIDMAGKPNDIYEPGRAYYLAVSTEPVSTGGYYAPAAAANAGSRATDAAKAALGNLGEDGYYSPVRAGVHDIVPFRKAGIPSLTLSWRCIASSRSSGADYGLASPYYIHTWDDNLYHFDMNSLYNTARLAAGAVARLALPYMTF